MILRPLAHTFAQHHRSLVRPDLQPERHERELDAHEVNDGTLLAHAGAFAAPDLESEARPVTRFET